MLNAKTQKELEAKNEEVIAEIAKKINFDLAYPMPHHESMDEFKETLKAAMEARTLIDTHNSTKKEDAFEGFVVLQKGEICPIYDNTYFCLNPLYLEDGKVHLANWATAGTVKGMHGVDGMKDVFKTYNEDMIEYSGRVFGHTPDRMRNLAVFMQFKGEKFFL